MVREKKNQYFSSKFLSVNTVNIYFNESLMMTTPAMKVATPATKAKVATLATKVKVATLVAKEQPKK